TAVHLQSPAGQENPPGERFEFWTNAEQILAIDEEQEVDIDSLAQSAADEWGMNCVSGWDGQETTLIQGVRPLSEFLDGQLKVCVASPDNLEYLISRTLDSDADGDQRLLDKFRNAVSPLIRVFQQAGLYKQVECASNFASTHTSLAFCVFKEAIDRLRPGLSLSDRWKVHLQLLVPALMCSVSNLCRIDAWLRVFSALEEELSPLCSDNDGNMSIEEIDRFIRLGKTAFEAGAEYFLVAGDVLFVIPAPGIKLDDSEELHCEDGPALVDIFGKANYFWHGERVSEKVIMSPLTVSDDELTGEVNERTRNLMISRRAEARYAWLANGFYLDPSFLFQTSIRKGGK
ncbi:MAG TPA: hypothetical protein VMH23_09535, partial [Bacteroidota bacterium]|nr:hypothetical protein [Bacteroidota bacterium]